MYQLEFIVYNITKSNPKIKLFVRDLYQLFFDIFPSKQIIKSYPVYERPGYFYGFHDLCPFSGDNSKLAACKYDLNAPLRMPLISDVLEVGYFDGPEFSNWHPVGCTRAWNWHQGCRLQWCDGRNSLVFNDNDSGHNISHIIDIKDNIIKTFDRPISSVSPDGNWAISYNFNRVNQYMPGYGYSFLNHDKELEEKIPSKDGLFIIDLNKGKDQMPGASHHIQETFSSSF